MKTYPFSRRKFVATFSATTIAAAASSNLIANITILKAPEKLAIKGGDPIRKKDKPFPEWPYVDDKIVDSVVKTTKSGIWCRIQSSNGTVPTFEKEFAKLIGTKYSLAVGSGTQALHTCTEVLGIGPGDEVITSPLTDPGTISSILTSRALPVMADVNIETMQIEPAEIEKRITSNTKAIMPVHWGGQSCDMDRIMAIAKKHNLRVIEDSCQAAMNEYKGKRLGTIGDLGTYSFQSSKTIACGEGGAIVGNDEELMDKCFTFHNHGTDKKGLTTMSGPKYRMNEFQAAVLLGQMEGVIARAQKRRENGLYLNAKLKDFQGVVPQKLYDGDAGCFYLYQMLYNKEHFNGISRDVFLRALAAEGVSLSPFHKIAMNREPWTQNVIREKVYTKMFSPARLTKFTNELNCPNTDNILERIMLIWASGPLLGTKEDMDDIVNAIHKIYENRDQLKSI
jgi:dTDP-4-amino-4,6-dideoxygalactose transaminase